MGAAPRANRVPASRESRRARSLSSRPESTFACTVNSEMGATLRRAAFAGSWYPRTAGAIAAEVDHYLDAAGAPEVRGRVVALVSPHAGLHYSGPVAAHSYALLRERKGVSVVLVGPAHRAAFEGVAVHASGSWETPLGTAAIDHDLASALLEAEPLLFDDP